VYLINASNPLSQMTLVWEGESQVHCIVEHHRGHLYLFTDAAREGVPVDAHYIMQSVVESSGPNSWKVQIIHLLCYVDFFLNPCSLHIQVQSLCDYYTEALLPKIIYF
jgi:hypothetical protein